MGERSRGKSQFADLSNFIQTPLDIARLCERPEKHRVPKWWEVSSAESLLGPERRPLRAAATKLFEAARSGINRHDQEAALRVLSLADGFYLDEQLPPTTVLLAHAFASGARAPWSRGQLGKIELFGSDRGNAPLSFPAKQTNWHPPGLEPWVKLQSLRLDNSRDLRQQLERGGEDGCAQCAPSLCFDVVFMRQGLCFCDEPHKSGVPPDTVEISGSCMNLITKEMHRQLSEFCLDGEYDFDGLPDPSNLNKFGLRMPMYKKRDQPQLTIRWRRDDFAWVVRDESSVDGQTLARIEGEAQNPSDMWGLWELWEAGKFKKSATMCCEKSRVAGGWSVPAQHRVSCGGVRAEFSVVFEFLCSVTSVLDASNPEAFALLQGSDVMGSQADVKAVLEQFDQGVALFNKVKPQGFSAMMLMRSGAPLRWKWDGVLVSRAGENAGVKSPSRCAAGECQIHHERWEVVD